MFRKILDAFPAPVLTPGLPRLDKYLNTRFFSFSAVLCDVVGIAGVRTYGDLVAIAYTRFTIV